jgi:DNA-directed RNA polymerase III subunit RPC1
MQMSDPREWSKVALRKQHSDRSVDCSCRLPTSFSLRLADVRFPPNRLFFVQIAEQIEEVYKSSECFLQIKIDIAAIAALQLQIDLDTIKNSIASASKLKLGDTVSLPVQKMRP